MIARPETSPSTAARDTVFTWQVTGPGALSGLTTIFRDVSDAQPILAAGGRIVADGSAAGGEVHLWTLALNQRSNSTFNRKVLRRHWTAWKGCSR